LIIRIDLRPSRFIEALLPLVFVSLAFWFAFCLSNIRFLSSALCCSSDDVFVERLLFFSCILCFILASKVSLSMVPGALALLRRLSRCAMRACVLDDELLDGDAFDDDMYSCTWFILT